MSPIPAHLARYAWYAPHLAWLAQEGNSPRHAVPEGTAPKRADLTDARLTGARLTFADLSGAELSGANLSGAELSGADLRGAVGLPAAPVVEGIDAAILAAVEADGCGLAMGSWHTCATTHCRAGWAIHLAGKAGYALERELGSSVAGALIYAASRPGRPVPDFYATASDALADLRACAAQETP